MNDKSETAESFVETKKPEKSENSFIWFLPSVFLVGFLAAWLLRGTFIIDEEVPIKRAHSLIDRNFYKDKTDSDKLYYEAIDGMIKALDDEYSAYYPPAEVGSFNKATTGKYAGIGVQISLEEDGRLRILTPMPDSPALKAGIKTGDKILKVDGKDAVFKSSDEAVDKLSGVEDSEVVLTVQRWKSEEILDITLTRKIVISPSVVGVRAIDVEGKKIGYLRMKSFQDKTALDVETEISNLVSVSKIDGLIIDLRFNRGGQLVSVNQIVDYFLPKNKLIVYTSGRNPENNYNYTTTEDAKFNGLPLVILVNENSASASEIMAGALQDHQRALIVGEKTYGKGKVQNVYSLDIFHKSSKLKLTTALYFTPSGRCIQKNTKEMYCPVCGSLFDEVNFPEFEYCPYDKTPLKLYDSNNYYRGGIQPDIEIPMNLREDNFLYVKHHVEEIIGDVPFVTENEQNILDEKLGDKQLDAALAIFAERLTNSDIIEIKEISHDE